ncbi:hypothetical protein GGS26DRAFT_468277 [Hypomontagnella submonticulosa]|nr:hypothetical protein GGS26DRAFT_468277 [Hypomontagnella submonticulosa]
MAKWDKTRDYYADLEISSNASTEEIRKQFRKLALKYHPDRNPGRESEVNPKFQTIQSAHEILVDDALRRQYDDARKTYSSRFPRASGVRGNPWQDISKQYQPPPTRNGTQASSNRPHSGAQRYAHFTAGVPRTSRPNNRDDPQSRKAYAEAWENMRPNSARRGTPHQSPGRAPTSATRDARGSDSESIPRTAWQQQKAQASFGNRRTGFTPRSPGQSDEPPVTNKNYFTTRTHSQIFNDAPPRSPSEAPSTPRASAPADPLAQFREKVWDERQSMPYHTPGGEKTSLFDDAIGLGRTSSTRSPRKPEMPGAFPAARPRSSSTPKDPSSDTVPEDPSRFHRGTNTTTGRPTLSETKAYQSQFNNRSGATPEPNNITPQTQPGPAGRVPGPIPSTYAAQDRTTNSPSVYAASENPPKPSKAPNPQGHVARDATNCTNKRPLPFAFRAPSFPGYNTHSPSSEGVKLPQNPSLHPIEERQREALNHLINSRSTPGRDVSTVPPKTTSQPQPISNLASTKLNKPNTNNVYFSSFSFASSTDASSKSASTNGLAQGSIDSINTRFVADELPEDWAFSAGAPSSNDPQTPTKVRPHSRSRITRKQVPRPGWAEADRMPSTQEGLGGAAAQGFSAGEWSDKIGSQHFVPQPSRSASSSPTRRANLKKSKPVKMTAGTAGLVDEDESEGSQGTRHTSSEFVPAGADSSTAMDIDSPPPEKVNDTPKVPHTNGARKIPVEPHRAEWRAGDVNGVRTKSASPIRDGNFTMGPVPQPAAPQPMPQPMHQPVPQQVPQQAPQPVPQPTPQPVPQPTSMPKVNPFVTQHSGSEDTDDFRTTLSDFTKLEPFVDPTPKGLKDFGDLKSTLPFQSQPSEQIPIEKEHVSKPLTLQFPAPPVAPRLPPSMLTAGIRPNQVQFSKYAQDFYQYMDKWEAFNARIMAHFSTRQENFKIRRLQRGAAWLDMPHGGNDAAREYLTELKQDQAVRQQWVAAHADHQAKICEFMKFRDQVK